ncbi:hypothetical protein Tco_0984819 [Tanacetum coccineum]
MPTEVAAVAMPRWWVGYEGEDGGMVVKAAVVRSGGDDVEWIYGGGVAESGESWPEIGQNLAGKWAIAPEREERKYVCARVCIPIIK